MITSQLDRRISIEKKVVTIDANYGTELVTWAALTTTQLPASVVDTQPSRSESVKQGLAVAKNQSTVTIRYRNDVDSSMRIVLHTDIADVVYQIVGGPATIERKKWTEFVVERYSS